MKLVLKNIAKVKEAKVELNGITVIAGENNTGKSTVGKALYCIVKSCRNYPQEIYNVRIESIQRSLNPLYRRAVVRFRDRWVPAEEILRNSEQFLENPDLLETKLREYTDLMIPEGKETLTPDEIHEIAEKVMTTLRISNGSILRRIVRRYFNAEFNGQINHVFTGEKGSITLETDLLTAVTFEQDEAVGLTMSELSTDVVYIDNPLVLGQIRPLFLLDHVIAYGHEEDLERKILQNDHEDIIANIVAEDKLKKIYGILNRICDGDLVKDGRIVGYKIAGQEGVLDAKNLSTGLKTFAIIKTLLQNGTLQEKGVLILDEPEIHLHPEWQLLFAELIVLIQKEFDMRVLLNTHSPYFLKAIEKYSAKYEIADKCKYYLAYPERELSVIRDVTEAPEEIYYLLGKPLQTLENVGWEDD